MTTVKLTARPIKGGLILTMTSTLLLSRISVIAILVVTNITSLSAMLTVVSLMDPISIPGVLELSVTKKDSVSSSKVSSSRILTSTVVSFSFAGNVTMSGFEETLKSEETTAKKND